MRIPLTTSPHGLHAHRPGHRSPTACCRSKTCSYVLTAVHRLSARNIRAQSSGCKYETLPVWVEYRRDPRLCDGVVPQGGRVCTKRLSPARLCCDQFDHAGLSRSANSGRCCLTATDWRSANCSPEFCHLRSDARDQGACACRHSRAGTGETTTRTEKRLFSYPDLNVRPPEESRHAALSP